MKTVSLLVVALCFMGASLSAEEDWQAKYNAKTKTNDETIGVIAGVINYVCPKILKDPKKICNDKDPVGSALNIEKTALGPNSLDDLFEMRDDEQDAFLQKQGFSNPEAAVQMVDAVDQFKQHYPQRENAKNAAAKKNWQEAFLFEEQAFQYLVKTASRGLIAKGLVDK